VEKDTTVNSLSAIPIAFKAQVIDDKIAVYRPGKREERRDHFDSRADSVDEICVSVQADIRGEYIIDRETEPVGDPMLFDICTAKTGPSVKNDERCIRVFPDPDLNSISIMFCNIFPDARLNMFIGAHLNRI
jgi:hypothetical protein